jgi:hypothetical protein
VRAAGGRFAAVLGLSTSHIADEPCHGGGSRTMPEFSSGEVLPKDYIFEEAGVDGARRA